MLFSLLKHHLDLNITDTALKVSRSISLILYLMVLKTISPDCGVRAFLMLFFINEFTEVPGNLPADQAVVIQ